MNAREEALEQIRSGLAGIYSGDALTAATNALATRLGAEIREEVETELRAEFENDLRRIREEVFDLGVRTAIRLANETRAISPTAGKQLEPKLAANASRARLLERLRPGFEAFVDDVPEEWSEISDVPIHRSEKERRALVDDLLDVVSKVIP